MKLKTLGLAASFVLLTLAYLRRPVEVREPELPTLSVLVATDTVPLGQSMDARDVDCRTIQADLGELVLALEPCDDDVADRRARRTVYEGEILTQDLFPSSANLPPPGTRAVAIEAERLPQGTSAGQRVDLVAPGQEVVDVMVLDVTDEHDLTVAVPLSVTIDERATFSVRVVPEGERTEPTQAAPAPPQIVVPEWVLLEPPA